MTSKSNALWFFESNNLHVALDGIKKITNEIEKVYIRCDIRPVINALIIVLDKMEEKVSKGHQSYEKDVECARLRLRAILKASPWH